MSLDAKFFERFNETKDPAEHTDVLANGAKVFCRNDPCGRRWGEDYRAAFVTPDRRIVTMRRKGQRCRFFDEAGVAVGPEHRNVVPAIIWAHAQGWDDTDSPAWLNAGVKAEIAANARRRS